VQLPFPSHIDIGKVLEAIPTSQDVDGVHYEGGSTLVLPPVVGAISEIARLHDVLFATQKVVVVGKGKLVGAPAYVWCQTQGANVEVVDRETKEANRVIASAHILILGAGQPGLVTKEMIKEGCIIFDAGTSEDGGVLKGDAHPDCATKAALFTPVPGGIGPITIAILLRNLIILARTQ
jgi:methylenetetrahydrofolate dehydrogenase (NADP+)/methenyltetrahydrofolate cyclohydrolase